MREIALSGGEPPLRVYDTSGPQGGDVREGLPALRRPWIEARGGVVDGPRALTVSSDSDVAADAARARRARWRPRFAAPVRSRSCTTRARA